jgi:hypothetical protein
MISHEELQARIKAYADANGIPFEEFARNVNAGAEKMRGFMRSMDELVTSAGSPPGEIEIIAGNLLDVAKGTEAARPAEIEGKWWFFGEPPTYVTRVRSDDGRDVVIRHRGKPKLWATTCADRTPVIPQDGTSQEQGLGWVAWLDLNLMAVMYDDTERDER